MFNITLPACHIAIDPILLWDRKTMNSLQLGINERVIRTFNHAAGRPPMRKPDSCECISIHPNSWISRSDPLRIHGTNSLWNLPILCQNCISSLSSHTKSIQKLALCGPKQKNESQVYTWYINDVTRYDKIICSNVVLSPAFIELKDLNFKVHSAVLGKHWRRYVFCFYLVGAQVLPMLSHVRLRIQHLAIHSEEIILSLQNRMQELWMHRSPSLSLHSAGATARFHSSLASLSHLSAQLTWMAAFQERQRLLCPHVSTAKCT